MTALHTLGILSTSFTWIAFPTVLKEFPYMLSTYGCFPSLCGPTHPKPSQLGWGRLIVEARSSDVVSSKQLKLTCVNHHCHVAIWGAVNLSSALKITLGFPFQTPPANHLGVRMFGSDMLIRDWPLLWWNCLSWGPPQEWKTQSYLCCRG